MWTAFKITNKYVKPKKFQWKTNTAHREALDKLTPVEFITDTPGNKPCFGGWGTTGFLFFFYNMETVCTDQ